MDEKLWWVRLPSGEEFGPISTSSLNRLIQKGMVTVSDEIADHQKKFYQLASTIEIFGPMILDVLANKKPSIPKDEVTEALQNSVSKTIESDPNLQMTSDYKKESFIDQRLGSAKMKVLKPEVTSIKEARKLQIKRRERSASLSYETLGKSILILVIVASSVYLLKPESLNAPPEAIHLVAVVPSEKSKTDEELTEIQSKVLAALETDNFSNYFFAMNQLVPAAESSSKKLELLSLLCLVYFELWPFSYQDNADLLAITKLTQITSKLDPVGPHGAICRSTQHIVNNHFAEANHTLDSALSENSDIGLLYLLKAYLLAAQDNFSLAGAYAEKAQQLTPRWTKPKFLEALFLYRTSNNSEATSKLRNILSTWPKHMASKVLLGIIEWKVYSHADEAIEILKPALTGVELVNNELRGEGADSLARAYLTKQDRSSAIDWSKKAFLWNPTLPGVKEFLTKVGGPEVYEEVSRNDRENLALGDQYFLSGNYLSAQAHFKLAHEQNPQNSSAALKTGLALSKLNQSHEAIEWFKKAIAISPERIDAHVALAEMYASRYDFVAASAILKKALSQAPKNYEVYRGLAQLALKRNDFLAATSEAKKALALYDTDIASMLILIKAHRGLGQLREAYTLASHTLELEKSNPTAQALYGEVLADVQGGESGINYLQNLVNTFPNATEYGISLAKLEAREGRIDSALQTISRIVSGHPHSKEALLLQGTLLTRTKKKDDALAALLSAAALDPSDVEPIFLMGVLYLEINQASQALQQFEKVVASNSNFPKVRISMGQAALMMGDTERALKEAAHEKRLNPSFADSYILSGDIFMRLKQYSKAASEYQSAAKFRNLGAEIFVKLARAYRLTGQYDVAISMLKTAESRESGNSEVAKEFGAVSEQRGDNVAAVKYYNRYLQILPNAPDKGAIVERITNLGGNIE